MQIFFTTFILIMLVGILTFSRMKVFKDDLFIETLFSKKGVFCFSDKLNEAAKQEYDDEHIERGPSGRTNPYHGFISKVSLYDILHKDENGSDPAKKAFFKELAKRVLAEHYQEIFKNYGDEDYQNLLDAVDKASSKNKKHISSIGGIQNLLFSDKMPGKLLYEIFHYDECSPFFTSVFSFKKSNGILISNADPSILRALFPGIDQATLDFAAEVAKMKSKDPALQERSRQLKERLLPLKADFVDVKYLKFPEPGAPQPAAHPTGAVGQPTAPHP